MNTYEVKMVIKTYSEDPEDWIVDSVALNLEDEGETIESIEINRKSDQE